MSLNLSFFHLQIKLDLHEQVSSYPQPVTPLVWNATAHSPQTALPVVVILYSQVQPVLLVPQAPSTRMASALVISLNLSLPLQLC